MLESRSAYGYYGELGGASGETPPKTHKRGWEFGQYIFKTNEPTGMYDLSIKACDYAHALKQAKAYAKKWKVEVLGVVETYGVPTEEKRNIEWYREEQK